MIVFDLQCGCGCQFEGWFSGRDDFDRQYRDGLLSCPECGSTGIRKILSPVAIRSGCSRPEDKQAIETGQPEITPETALRFLRAVQEVVEKNFEDVGTRLAEESLKIHYGVAPARNIRGFATAAEEKMLQEEGIELLKVPVVKKPPESKPQ
ncbi:MAG: DUF1178 family protein [Desulfobulbaceae bacterium]